MEEILNTVNDTEIPSGLLSNLITWLRKNGRTDEEIVDCLLFICKENGESDQ